MLSKQGLPRVQASRALRPPASNVEEETSVVVAEVVVVVEVVDELLPLSNDFNNTFDCCCCSALVLAIPPGGRGPDPTAPGVIIPGPDPAEVMVTPNEGTTDPCNTVVGITVVVEESTF